MILHDFYADLYSESGDQLTQQEILEFLDAIKSLPKIKLVDTLVGPILEKEVKNALKKLRIGKAPGCDGITADFYKHFIEELSPILTSLFNQIFEDQELTLTQKLEIISLIFKKGDDRLVPNYHPISLMNCDYKILAYILVTQMEESLPLVIHPNQTAYMKNRFIGTNICSVQDIITQSVEDNTIVLFLDFRKAFDTVNHLFLTTLLIYMGFLADFVTWITIMYVGATSLVRHKNWLTESFPLLQGVRQGCPLSCHLFNLVGPVLIYLL